MTRRVVVTGMGVVSPVGIGRETFWRALLRGTSGIGPVTRFDASALPAQIAGEVKDFEPERYLPRRDIVRTDALIRYALVAAGEAVEDAKLDVGADADRIGVTIGTGMGDVPRLVAAHDALRTQGFGVISPYALPAALPHMAAAWVSMRTGARGVLGAPATACVASAQAIGDAFRLIQAGAMEAMIAGGADAALSPVLFAGFAALRALSTRNDEPERACRPFDRGHDGTVLAEGAGVLVLEERERALSRGARVYCEIVGYGATADAYHVTAPSSEGPARAIRMALADARLEPAEVDYINAHGTGTPQNDVNETRAIKAVFGPSPRVAVSATKSMTGHLLGAASAVEVIATALSIAHGMLPPTINQDDPDPECDLDTVPNIARAASIEAALSNSFAFGGANAVLAFRHNDF